MSVENAKALLAKVKDDKELVEKCRAAGAEGFEKLAAEAEHPCNEEHLKSALEQSGQLSEADLNSVVGGTAYVSSVWAGQRNLSELALQTFNRSVT